MKCVRSIIWYILFGQLAMDFTYRLYLIYFVGPAQPIIGLITRNSTFIHIHTIAVKEAGLWILVNYTNKEDDSKGNLTKPITYGDRVTIDQLIPGSCYDIDLTAYKGNGYSYPTRVLPATCTRKYHFYQFIYH